MTAANRPSTPPLTPVLTDAEHALVADLGQLWGNFCRMVGDGPTRAADLQEVVFHIHALQHFVMAQAAARAYPGLYRLAGRQVDDPAHSRASSDDQTGGTR